MKNPTKTPDKNTEAELAACIDKFSPEMAKAIRAVRAALRKKVPAANELVYDNYNFFVIGYSPTLRPSDTFFSLIADAHGVRIGFYWGSKLPDPKRILQGGGSQHRFIALESARDLEQPEVAAVIRAAIAHGKPLSEKDRGTLVIRSISAKQRPRRVAEKKKSKR
ncbi:MAG TPA: hypothetical protein VMT38_04580 [Terracidiphilus sp.]|nr:hypothetical protein [Terracidiphilus sp.]